jgi:hypothetical protein
MHADYKLQHCISYRSIKEQTSQYELKSRIPRRLEGRNSTRKNGTLMTGYSGINMCVIHG